MAGMKQVICQSLYYNFLILSSKLLCEVVSITIIVLLNKQRLGKLMQCAQDHGAGK